MGIHNAWVPIHTQYRQLHKFIRQAPLVQEPEAAEWQAFMTC